MSNSHTDKTRSGSNKKLPAPAPVTSDQHAKKASPNELKHNESALLSAIVQSSDDAIIGKTLEGTILTWNEGAQRILGYAPEEIIGKHISILIPHNRMHEDGLILDKLKHGERIEHFETQRLRKDGSLVDLSLTVSPIKTDSGTIFGSASIAHDITRRRQVEAVLESERYMRAVLDQAYSAFVAINPMGMVTKWNHRAQEIFGWSRDEVMGQELAGIIIPQQYRNAHREGLKRYHATGEGTILNKRVEMSALRRDGSEFPIELSIFPVHVGTEHSFCAFIADISERKALLQQLEQQKEDLERSNNELQRFAYVAAHDLKEPLRTIVSYTNLLAEENKGTLSQDAEENMRFIVDAGKRMQLLIADLLAYSRVETQAKPLIPTPCNDIFDMTVAGLQTTIDEAHGKISRDELPTVLADQTQLEQLFLNLLGNALKFRGNNPPHVHVSAQADDGNWLFCVKDNGIGLDMKFADRIFQMFQRLHSMREYPGTGIGLAICKKIVERHKGRIWVESAPGQGTAFYFTLPAVEPQAD